MNRNYAYHKNYHAGLGNGEPKLRRRHDATPQLNTKFATNNNGLRYRNEDHSRLRARASNADNNIPPPVAVVVEDGPYFSILVWLLCTITFVLVILFLQEVFHPTNSQTSSTNSKSSKSKQKNSDKKVKERSRKHKIDEYYTDDDYYFGHASSSASNHYYAHAPNSSRLYSSYTSSTHQQQNLQYQYSHTPAAAAGYNFNDMSIDSSMYYRTHARKRASSNTYIGGTSVQQSSQSQQNQQPHILNVPPNTSNSVLAPAPLNVNANTIAINSKNMNMNASRFMSSSSSAITNLDIEYGSSDDNTINKYSMQQSQHQQQAPSKANSNSASSNNTIHQDLEQHNLAGEVILSKIIGEGGFGSVWRGDWRGTPVAIKMLTLPPIIDAAVKGDNDEKDTTTATAICNKSNEQTAIALEKLKTFQSEMNLLKSLRHPNVCLFLGFIRNEADGGKKSKSTWGLVMELCEHGSLWDALRRPLPPNFNFHLNNRGIQNLNVHPIGAPVSIWPNELILRVASGAARGIAYLHSRNPPILHRDLKSANLLLDASFHVKIADFGLSTIVQQGNDTSPLTQNCGTVQWMAPEVLQYSSETPLLGDNNNPYGPPADVYSFAIILWELVTQECPFESCVSSRNDPLQVALAVIQRDVRPVVPRWVCERYRDVILRCWRRDPSRRMRLEDVLTVLGNLTEVGDGI
uniref:Protein kinase domain-containing protein n=1 Tax=Leptocylindrus danicus TaxID=163516 RepID=A0A7S2L3E6_9STRA|mmetsp:Transcript_30341/g.44659  ORF Transcript_30341/g.44659 Transcript_30341/m.44659 type:complete len:689 (+) Transcript_30341:171-2237(+)|eukprot:CAMPEP_0116027056 /NCGR_PEP_ID=MMETSP0321-20121206/14354_1 /TAXON_ID=163516 /ORGANISM="Leptocylindrus danicus var. danicus, Strain B650" /LENGTH=688 /DNA_ID=CAMNT_0003500243 /DNA_START=171 /DNA_END=2237 /DNA_ORIENTATION=+